MRCPECGGKVIRAGKLRVNRKGNTRQQWRCPNCGRRTVNPIGGK